jgi:hypothetical protein
MRVDDLDTTLREALHHEATAEAYCLEGLEDRIATEVAGRLPRRGLFDRLRGLLAPTRGARVGQLAVVGATAAIFLLVGIFVAERVSLFGPGGGTPAVAAGGVDQVLFLMPAPGAHSVTLVGSFNDWEPTPLSDKNDDGIWRVQLKLPPGRYEYAFVVDGRWWGQDPLADEYVRSFGEYNSVRYVGQVGGGA